MTSLLSNLVKRIDRFPKPTSAAGAMQPMFEAISNAIHATQAKYSDQTGILGKVIIDVSLARNKREVRINIQDNGYGLDKKNWDAFLTTDTDNKIEIGGKGVGRLLWLDCFERINIISRYLENGVLNERRFDFVLSSAEQIENEKVSRVAQSGDSFFFVSFSGLRNNGYFQKFPGRGSYIFQHLTSHFLPIFIGNRCPLVECLSEEKLVHFRLPYPM